MAGKYLELAVILKAVDQMSGTVRSALGGASAGYNALANSQQRAQASMSKGMVMGAAAFMAIDALKSLADKFGDVDAAQRQLKISEMKPGGIVDGAAFEKQMVFVKALSNLYGEHQSAYVDMIKVMKNYHLDDSDILGGTGKSVALLSKLFESSPDAGALFASRMKTDFRVNADEMGKMVDMAVRLKQLNTGISGEEMLHNLTEFSAGIALSSQNLGMHGAKDASELQILGAMYTSKGIDAPQVATTLRRIFENITKPERLQKMDEAAAKYGKHMHFFDSNGKFEGIDNLVAQLGTLKNLKPSAVTEILGVLGSAQGMSSVMLKNISKFGTDDFREFKKNYADQGTPEQKLAEMMGGQTEAAKRASVALENLAVTIGKSYSPAVKEASSLSEKFFHFIDRMASEHSTVTNITGVIAGIGTALLAAGSAWHLASYAWTSWGAGTIFRAIGGLGIWGRMATAASDFAYVLSDTLLTSVGTVSEAFAAFFTSATVGLAALAAAPIAFGLWEANYGSASKMLAKNEHDAEFANSHMGMNGDVKKLFDKKDKSAHIDLKLKPIAGIDYQDHIKHDATANITNQMAADLRKNNNTAQKPTLVYSPTININGTAQITKQDIGQILDTHGSKLMDMINKQHADKLRTNYK
jgi:hypothetical protein